VVWVVVLLVWRARQGVWQFQAADD
jgi:hypothetical protein